MLSLNGQQTCIKSETCYINYTYLSNPEPRYIVFDFLQKLHDNFLQHLQVLQASILLKKKETHHLEITKPKNIKLIKIM